MGKELTCLMQFIDVDDPNKVKNEIDLDNVILTEK